MKYNIKDYFEKEKFEEVIKRFAKNHPDATNEELQAVREFYENASEKEINEIIFEVANRKAEQRWAKVSIIILILGTAISCIMHNWLPVLVGVGLILILMCVFIYLNTKFLEKHADISLSEQEILNKFRFNHKQPESEKK